MHCVFRYIVVHAGTEDGFVPNASLVFASKSRCADYHGEMNHVNFINWFENKLLINLEEPSIIIMDNAPYHSSILEKAPNSSWKKNDIKLWLESKNIEFSPSMFKGELLKIVQV